MCGRFEQRRITDKSFLVLFFKKEQKKESSFLKKRSKKLLSIGAVSKASL
jgi:hypothetical protein